MRITLLFLLLLAQASAPGQVAEDIAGCAIFPGNNIWNTPVDNLPRADGSDQLVATIGAAVSVHADFGSGTWNGGPIGIPFITVPGTQAKVDIEFLWADESDPGPYPIPPDAPIEGGADADGDRHVLVLDRDHCRLYELYRAFPMADGSWQADSGAVYDLSANTLRPDGWTSADAAGLPVLPGLVRYDEVASGEITHALRFTAPQTRRACVWPARHYASSLTGSQYPPMGQRFRLRADYDVSGFSSPVQVILRAMKKYGIILADNGSPWYISGAPDERWDNDMLHELDAVTGSDFEAVDCAALQVDPDSGEARMAGEIELVSPNGGESWITGSSHAITWTATAYTGLVRLVLYDGNAKVGQIAGGLGAGAGTYSWTVGQHQGGTAPAGANYRVRIVSNDGTLDDWSDAGFAVAAPPALRLLSPHGGERWLIGNVHPVTWQATSYAGLVRLVLYDGNTKVGQITGGLSAGAGTYSWTVGRHSGGTTPAGANYRVRIVSNDGVLSDWSDSTFVLESQALRLTSPNGGESWAIGSVREVTWSAADYSGLVRLVLFDGSTKVGAIATGLGATAGPFSWTVGQHQGGTAPAGAGYRVRVVSSDGTVSDWSDAAFRLAD